MKHWKKLLLIGVFLAGCTPGEKEVTENEIDVEEVEAIAEEKPEVATINPEVFNGFWSNENYIYTIENEALYIMNLATKFVNSYNIAIEELTENSMVLNLSDVREDHTTPFITTADTVMQYDQNESVIFMDQTFTPAADDSIPDAVNMFVTSEGLARYHTYQAGDLVIEDFTGYWSPRNKDYAHYLNPQNDYTDTHKLFIDPQFMMAITPGSVGAVSHIFDYTIEGNELYLYQETFDDYAIWDQASPEHLPRFIRSRGFTLYQEEDGDRLVDNESGVVMTRISEEEMTAIFDSNIGELTLELGNEYLAYYENNGFPPATRADAKPLASHVSRSPTHYPYSTTAALSVTQLFEEAQIIAGNIPHPAGDINTDVVLNEFIVNGEFSQTATLNRRPYDDVGYMFKEDFIFYGAGSVTGWRDDMKGFDIHDYSMDGYEIEVVMSDQDNSEGEFSEKYFWIDENIMYKMDEAGNYTDRYENIGYGYEDVWQFYHNLPDHQLYGQN